MDMQPAGDPAEADSLSNSTSFCQVTKKKAAIIGNTEELFKLVGPLTNPRSNPGDAVET